MVPRLQRRFEFICKIIKKIIIKQVFLKKNTNFAANICKSCQYVWTWNARDTYYRTDCPAAVRRQEDSRIDEGPGQGREEFQGGDE